MVKVYQLTAYRRIKVCTLPAASVDKAGVATTSRTVQKVMVDIKTYAVLKRTYILLFFIYF